MQPDVFFFKYMDNIVRFVDIGTDRRDIAEIFLKVALNTIKPNQATNILYWTGLLTRTNSVNKTVRWCYNPLTAKNKTKTKTKNNCRQN
jgi:hypothetical protein